VKISFNDYDYDYIGKTACNADMHPIVGYCCTIL